MPFRDVGKMNGLGMYASLEDVNFARRIHLTPHKTMICGVCLGRKLFECAKLVIVVMALVSLSLLEGWDLLMPFECRNNQVRVTMGVGPFYTCEGDHVKRR